MATGSSQERSESLLASAQRMLEIVADDRADRAIQLRRLTSVVVADFPRALFKLQVVDPESQLRFVPEFVSPLIQSIIDRYRETLGPLDVRDACIPAEADSIAGVGLKSHGPIRLESGSEIADYFSAHFVHADRDRLGEAIRDDLRIREVLLLPVRPHDVPFGVVSVSSATRIGQAQETYWRSVVVAIEAVFRHSQRRLIESLRALALARSEVPTILVDGAGEPIEVNRAAAALLGFRDRSAMLLHLGNLRPCLPARGTFSTGCEDDPAFYIADAHGAEVACTVHTRTLDDDEGRTLGAVIEIEPVEDLTARSVRLTRRQREVARLIAEGRTTKEVAYELGLSVHTVNYHRAQIREQLAGQEASGDLATKIRRFFLGER